MMLVPTQLEECFGVWAGLDGSRDPVGKHSLELSLKLYQACS